MATSRGKNTILKLGDGSGSEVFTQITKCTNIKFDAVQWDQEDVTNHDAATPVKQSEPTLYDNGNVTFTLTYDPNNTQHAALNAMKYTGAMHNFQHILPNSVESKQWQGYMKSFEYVTEVGSKLKANVVIKINGATSDIV